VNLFDNDAFAGQRVRRVRCQERPPQRRHQRTGRNLPGLSRSAAKKGSPIRFLPIDRINTILAVSPNPAAFDEVEKWIGKLDIPAKVTVGSTDNFVYRLRYARAEVMGSVVMQLYGGAGYPLGNNLYGGMPGNSTYPSSEREAVLLPRRISISKFAAFRSSRDPEVPSATRQSSLATPDRFGSVQQHSDRAATVRSTVAPLPPAAKRQRLRPGRQKSRSSHTRLHELRTKLCGCGK